MGYAFGLPRNAQGAGTTPEDMQRVIWSLYREHVARLTRGCEVTGTAAMRYRVAPGMAYIPMGDSRAVLVPVDAVEVATAAAQSSGSRTDFLYVGQDGAVKVGASLPAGAALIDVRTVRAGVTATTATTGLVDRQFTTLFGSTLGRVAFWHESMAMGATWDSSWKTRFVGKFTLPSDRLLDLRLTQTLYSTAPSSVRWAVLLDGQHILSRELAVGLIAESKYTARTWHVLAGEHTIELRAGIHSNGGKPIGYQGGGDALWPGNTFEVVDVGQAA